jgi:hypothetical protein
MGDNAPTPSQVRSLSTEELSRKTTKAGLIKALQQAVMNTGETDDEQGARAPPVTQDMKPIQELLQSILDEMKIMNAANERRDTQIKELQESNQMLKKTMAQQQRFLEMVDHDRRAANIIVLECLRTARSCS